MSPPPSPSGESPLAEGRRLTAGLLALLLAALAVLRLVAAAAIPLTEDEAYYRLWAAAPRLGYYDHPPMIAWWIWAGIHLAGDTALGVRLLPVAASLVSTLLVFDLLASAPDPIRVAELPYKFRDRLAGESKLDRRVVIEYLSLILNKATGGAIPTRAVMFALVGSTGFVVNVIAAMTLEASRAPLTFSEIQFLAAFVAMTSNFAINNAVTYFDRRKKGLAVLTAYVRFCLLCSAGLFVNVAVASFLNDRLGMPATSTVAGAAFGAVWNYVTTALAVW